MLRRISKTTLASAGLYCLAFFLTQVLHEGGHALAGFVLGEHPILYTSHVDHTVEVSDAVRLTAVLAGPLTSLFQGLVLMAVVRRLSLGPRLRLFVTWLAFHGLVNFVGYVFTTSFAPGADMGVAAELMGLPFVARLALTVAGYGGLRYLVRPLAVSFAALAAAPLGDESGRAWAKQIGIFAGAIATPILVVAALPVPHWLSLVYVIAAFLPLFDLPDAMVKAGARGGTCALGDLSPIAPAAAYLFVLAMGRLLLDGGVRLD